MTEPPRPERASWYRLDLADAVFLLSAVLVLQASRGNILDDPGLGWHLRNIDAMRAEGGWLTTDPFCGPRGGQPWYTNQWLGDLALWLGDKWAGLTGIALVVALVIALTMRCLYRMLLADGLSWPVAALWALLAARATWLAWLARPNVFTLFFVLVTARFCEQFHRGACSWRKLLWLWPMFVLWANTHGGFISGLVLLAATLAIEAGLALADLSPEARRAAGKRLGVLTGVTAGAFTCTLVNPYGWRLYAWIHQLLGDPFFMNLNFDWLSPDFHAPLAFRYELLLLLFPAILGLTRRKPNLVGLGLSVLMLHFLLGGQRFVPLWVVVAVPTMAQASVEIPWLNLPFDRWPISDDVRRFLMPRLRPAPFLGTVLISLGLLGWARWDPGFSRHDPQKIPTTALNRLLKLAEEPTAFFHDYNWGGYLTWHGWPTFRTWIDDRNEVQGRTHIQEYFALLRTEGDWQGYLRRHNIGLVCIRPETPLAYRLAEDRRWREVYRDGAAVIFRRAGAD